MRVYTLSLNCLHNWWSFTSPVSRDLPTKNTVNVITVKKHITGCCQCGVYNKLRACPLVLNRNAKKLAAAVLCPNSTNCTKRGATL